MLSRHGRGLGSRANSKGAVVTGSGSRKPSGRSFRRALAGTAIAGGALLVGGFTAAAGTPRGGDAGAGTAQTFSFKLVPSSGISACLPHASGRATITTGSLSDTLQVSISGMPPAAGFDLFVIQEPNKPFGVSWYQSNLNTGNAGTGSVTVEGRFDRDTFSVSPGGTVTFAPTHQFHLGVWFNNPNTPFEVGCEPGATSPIITPFSRLQHAGIQVLNTANFPDNAGPLSHVRR
jgi:hypothetical protein